jgi:hypothetical protein
MSNAPRDIDDRLKRRLVFRHSVVPGVGAVAVWIVYATDALFHIDLLHLCSDPAKPKSSPTLYLILAAITTFICIVVAIVQTRKAIALASFGVEVEGTIIHRGIAFRGLAKVECSYTAGHADHVFIWSAPRDNAPSVGDKVVLLVDPANPKRCMLIEDVFSDRKREIQAPLKTVPGRIVQFALYGFVAIGLAWMAWRGFHGAAPKPAPAVASAPIPANPPAVKAQAARKPVVKPPSKEILFQPMFVWENSEPTFQGTGFFVKAPGGKVAAVTSLHFLNVEGPHLREARWLSLTTDKPTAVLDRSWGPPGKTGVIRVAAGKDCNGKPIIFTVPWLDKRTDCLLMPVPAGIPASVVLELDP